MAETNDDDRFNNVIDPLNPTVARLTFSDTFHTRVKEEMERRLGEVTNNSKESGLNIKNVLRSFEKLMDLLKNYSNDKTSLKEYKGLLVTEAQCLHKSRSKKILAEIYGLLEIIKNTIMLRTDDSGDERKDSEYAKYKKIVEETQQKLISKTKSITYVSISS